MSGVHPDGIWELDSTALDELRQALPETLWTDDIEKRRNRQGDSWSLAVKKRAIEEEAEELPALVVKPESTEQVSELLSWASRNEVPVVPYGAGSGVVGGAVTNLGGVSLDMSTFNEIEEIDEENLLVTVGAGMLGGELEARLNEHGLICGHYPQSLYISTVGGWVACRGSGTFSSLYGNIEDMVAALEVVLPNGEIVNTKASPRSSAGPDLKQLFIGSEGTLGVITKITLKVWPAPEVRTLRAFSFPTFGAGLETIRFVVQRGIRPAVVRLYDPEEGRPTLEKFGYDPSGWLLVLAFEGTEKLVELEEKETAVAALSRGAVDLGREPAEHWEKNRFDASWLTERVALPGGIADAIEVAHVWTRLEDTYVRMLEAVRPHMAEVFGHVSHVYPQGASLYVICRSMEENNEAAERAYREAWDAAMKACLESGATIAHHHGIGLQRAPWMESEHGSGLGLLQTVKTALDPANIMNPGKLGLGIESEGR